MVSSGERQKRSTGRRKTSKGKEVKSEKAETKDGTMADTLRGSAKGDRNRRGTEAKRRTPMQSSSSFLDRNHSEKYIFQHDSVHTHTLSYSITFACM